MPPKIFLLVTLLAAIAVFCAPVTPITPLVLRAALSAAAVVMTGNSVIAHASHCDADTRSIPAMLAAAGGAGVLDLSAAGQRLGESANLAAISLRRPRVRVVLLTVSPFALMEEGVIGLRDYAAFRLLNPALPAEALATRLAWGRDQSGLRGPLQDAFTYDGVRYPEYDQLKARYLEPERTAMGCPETDGRDRAFMAAFYDHTYLRYPFPPSNFQLLAALAGEARRRGKDLRVVLMPVDAALMEALLPGAARRLRARLDAARAQLAQAGIAVVDLSDAVANDGFADRWCACGHLLQDGRRAVAGAIAASLAQVSPPTVPTPAD